MGNISKPNKHIEEYLDYYFNDDKKKLNYAIMINGAWGSGKTWFINQYIDKLKNLNRKPIYVSLNGIKNIEQLDGLIYSELYPVLNGKTGKSIWKGMGTLLKGMKIDLTGFDFDKFYRIKDSVVIFFDDMERCKIDLEELFGHINNFVENIGVKVVVVADENQIENKKYLKIKEKLIDATFNYTEDLTVVIDSIIREVIDNELRRLLESNKENIIRLFSVAGYKNLRSLKQTIYGFENFYDVGFFTRESNFYNEVFYNVFEKYLILSLENKRGKFPDGILNFQEDLDFLSKKNISEKIRLTHSGINSKEAQDFYSKYNLSIADMIFTKDVWENILLNRIFDRDIINDQLDEKYFRTEIEKPIWFKLRDYYDMDEQIFDGLIEQAKESLEKESLENWEDILHTFSALIYFDNISIIDVDLDCLKPHALNSFDKVFPIVDNLKSLRGMEYRDHASGVGYFAKEIQYFKDFLDEINNVYEAKYTRGLKDKADELVDLMKVNPNLFYQRINITNQSENLFYDIPILREIDQIRFSQELCDLPKSNLFIILRALETRYTVQTSDPIYLEEKDWLDQVFENINNVILSNSRRLKKAKIEQVIVPQLSRIRTSAYGVT